MQEKFVEFGLARCNEVKLWCASWIHDTERHFAACTHDGDEIYCAPEMADLPEGVVLAIFAHEFGHAVDFLYPAQFGLGRDGVVRRNFERVSDKQVRAWTRGWRARDDDAVERTADAIAQHVLGTTIGYCGPCQLQCFNQGVRRPAGLR